ncbi:MAG TPA: alanine racemase [Streptosporangiaceae bacterium]|nr:alanine racemase [Streptosporangiaceae bacterium]
MRTAEAIVDQGTIRQNTAGLRDRVSPAAVMGVVKSDGYGHGMIPAAHAALAGGASWLGVISVAEGLALRGAGITAPVLCLMDVPEAAHGEAIAAGVDLSVASTHSLARVVAAATTAGRPARVHLKADTGMSRGGATAADWPGLVDAALAVEAGGLLAITGLWSHLACADLPGHPSVPQQITAFGDAVELAEKAGARPEVRHLANTPATLTLPQTWFDLVRPGGGLYGLSTLPGGAAPEWMRPAMTARASLIQVKRVPAGSGVSYGHRYTTSSETTLGLVPAGYAEGVPRAASGRVQVQARGRRWTIAGTVCMNQFVIDLGDEPAEAGDEVVLFGPGDAGEPTAQEWAEALGTISYEIVTGFGCRWPKSYR